MSIRDFDVIVVGAGPAGLTAAHCLVSGSDLRVLVLESDPEYVGGISRTVRHNGFRFDIGGHRFFSKSGEINAMWRQMLPEGFVRRPRKSRIYYNGRFFDYPLNAIQALKNLGLLTSTHCLLSYLRARLFPVKPATNFRQWVTNQFGARLFEIFFKTYTEKVWGMSCEDISADWAAQRIKGLDLKSAVIDGLRRSIRLPQSQNTATRAKTLIESFMYPRLGPGMMWEAAAASIVRDGATLKMGATVTALAHEDGGWRITTGEADGIERHWTCREVVCSAPMRETVRAVSPRPTAVEAAERLRYRDFLTVVLIFDRPAPFDDNWIYVHDPSVNVGRIQNFASWSPDLLADNTKGCLGLEFFCFENDELWGSADPDLVALAQSELHKIGLCRDARLVDSVVVRQPKAYPVYDAEYQDVVETIRTEFSRRYPGFHFVGRNGMHKYNNQDHAMMTGILTAENIIAGRRRFDVWEVNSDAEYQEEISGDRSEALSSLRRTPNRSRT
jgi:protoporphyrinogen oxidase